MRSTGLSAAAAAICLAAALAVWCPARSDEDPWSRESVAARFPDPDAAAKPADFGDNAECKECHEDRVKSLATSFHEKLANAKKSGTRGCQECHGPGALHVDDGGDTPMRDPNRTADLLLRPLPAAPPKDAGAKEGDAKEAEKPREPLPVSVKAMNGVCLRCHVEVLTKPVSGHREWLARTRDASGERSCVSCHRVHVDRARPEFDATIGPFATAADLAKVATPVSPSLCIACHTEFHPQMARSGHAALMKDGPEHGCAACHGAGSLHVQSGGDPAKILMPEKQKPAVVDASCNECHAKGKVTAKWTCSEHSREGVSCIVCHDANAAAGRTLRKPEFELCGQCHVDVQAQFRMPSRHRVAEGRVSCSDCHDPHGNTDKVRDRDVRYTACLKCHQEKGGPHLYDHGIKRTEGCTACHDPHGSANRRMLTYQRIQDLCMQCHPDVPADHDLRKPKYANCISCHTEVHGSDLDRYFLK